MVVKQLDFGEDAKGKVKSGVKKLAKAVKSTLGAGGRFVAIESQEHLRGFTVTKDGVTVAKSINLPDPVEDLAVRMARQAAENTAEGAGDGTTTSIVLMEAIINASEELITEDNDKIEVARYIKKISDRIVGNLTNKSKKLTKGRRQMVATVSANNDGPLGKMISDAYDHVGELGIVSVADSKTDYTYVEKIDGIRIDRGYTSTHYITDHKTHQAVLDHPLILLTDIEIESPKSIMHLLEFAVKSNRSLLIVGEMKMSASAAIAYNVKKGNMKVCNIIPPSNGTRRDEMMRDLSKITGATFVSESLGNDWGNVSIEDLGNFGKDIVSKAVISNNRAVLIQDNVNEAAIDLTSDLEAELRNVTDNNKKKILLERLSCIRGKAAIVNVGGQSDIEIKETKDRVDDSVFATRAAMEEGILPGGGIALLNESYEVKVESDNKDEITAANVLSRALEAPFLQIMTNAKNESFAHEALSEVEQEESTGYGYDVKKEQYGQMLKLGVIDPAKVTKTALQNAVSVSTTIMMLETTVTNARDYESVRG